MPPKKKMKLKQIDIQQTIRIYPILSLSAS